MSKDRPFVLCLTGSLAMGKSTAAKFFAECGVPVHDSDAVVHALYQGEAVSLIEAAFPGSTSGGKVDRGKLAAMVVNDSAALARLEGIIHPLVTASRDKFLAQAQARGAAVVVVESLRAVHDEIGTAALFRVRQLLCRERGKFLLGHSGTVQSAPALVRSWRRNHHHGIAPRLRLGFEQ